MPTGIQKPTRRYHRKSRTGCGDCRARRIKCDETHPTCANCQRASLTCHYSVQSQTTSLAGSPQNETLASTNSNGILSTLPTPAESATSFDMLDLTLMHHYTTTTSISLFGEEQRELWQVEVPIMARSSSLLMHGLLATAALHMAFLNKDGSDSAVYSSRALYHHSLGLELFNAHITNLSAENSNSHVLFTFGLLLVIWAYASPTLPTAASLNETTEYESTAANGGDLSTLLSSLELVRGNKAIFELSSETILKQPIGRFTQANDTSLSRPPTDTNSDTTSTSTSHSNLPSTFQSQVDPESTKESLRATTLQALTTLRRTIATDFIDTVAIHHLERALLDTISSSAADMRLPLGWPALVEAPFWERLRRRKPSALLILMHYAVILAYYERRNWWMVGWADRLVYAVDEAMKGAGDESRDSMSQSGNCLKVVLGLLEKVREDICSLDG